MKNLTDKQQDLLDFIEEYQKKHKVPPTFVEMASHFELTIAAIQSRLFSLERKKVIERKNIYIIKPLEYPPFTKQSKI